VEDQKVEWVNAFEVVVGWKTKSAPNQNIPAERQQASETTLNAIRNVSSSSDITRWRSTCPGGKLDVLAACSDKAFIALLSCLVSQFFSLLVSRCFCLNGMSPPPEARNISSTASGPIRTLLGAGGLHGVSHRSAIFTHVFRNGCGQDHERQVFACPKWCGNSGQRYFARHLGAKNCQGE